MDGKTGFEPFPVFKVRLQEFSPSTVLLLAACYSRVSAISYVLY